MIQHVVNTAPQRLIPLSDRCEKLEGLIAELWSDVLALKNHRQQFDRERDLLRTVLDTIPDYVFVKDCRSRFVFNNRAHLQQLRAREQVDTIGKTDFDFFPEELAHRYFNDEQNLFKNNSSILDTEEMTISPEGTQRWLSTSKVIIRDADDKAVGLVGISRDITKRKQAEQEQARLEEQILQSSKLESLGRLTGGIAHDFNNMLCAIRGYTQLLKFELPDLEIRLMHHIDAIEKAAISAGDLTKKLLAFGRKSTCQLTTVDIHDSIMTVRDLLERTIDRRIGIQLKLNAPSATILADRSLIENALLNVGVNARDAMPQGGELVFATETVEITSDSPQAQRLRLSPGFYVHVAISDTGVGMDEGTLSRVFEPFFTTKEQGKGTGLGLASVYGTVKTHHGGIEVTSREGQGTQVSIYLPQTASAKPVEQQRDSAVRTECNGTILVVDDEELVRNMVSTLLRKQGHRTITCGDGAEAVSYYSQHAKEIDLVIVDMIMPKLGGPDCMLHIRKMNPNATFIVMSGFCKPEESCRIPAIGVKGFLQKPFDSEELSRLVSRALDRPQPVMA